MLNLLRVVSTIRPVLTKEGRRKLEKLLEETIEVAAQGNAWHVEVYADQIEWIFRTHSRKR